MLNVSEFCAIEGMLTGECASAWTSCAALMKSLQRMSGPPSIAQNIYYSLSNESGNPEKRMLVIFSIAISFLKGMSWRTYCNY